VNSSQPIKELNVTTPFRRVPFVKTRSIAVDLPPALSRYVALYCVCFALYAIFGKGFAYVGIPPLYIGEVLLFAGLAVVLLTNSLLPLASKPFGLITICFGLWQLGRTVPYVSTYGIDAFRDAAAWFYAAFAWIVAALVVRSSGGLGVVVKRYRRFGSLLVFAAPVAAIATAYFSQYLLSWPKTTVTVPLLKCGDLCVHLAGAAAFVISGLGKNRLWWLLPVFVGAAFGGAYSRGGLLAFMMSMGIVLLLSLRPTRVLSIVYICTFIATLLLALDPHLSIPGRSRELSARQLVSNLVSVGDNVNNTDLDGTKTWRLDWWRKIVDYTFRGPYFWDGKGYGINLAASDGISAEQALRSPHNSHLTILARSGVPGFILWAALQLTWLGMNLSAFVRARKLGYSGWSSLFAWLIAYWLAFMINAAFDVALEGPMAAIPFWTVVGLGWGAHILFHQQARQLSRRDRCVYAAARQTVLVT
jgi:hypothetical protein